MANDALASLIVATFDLSVVRSIRDAIRTADIHSGKGQPVSRLGPAPSRIERRFRLTPEPEILPRRHIHPEPRIEPRRVIHPVDRFEPTERDLIPVPVPCECYKPGKKHALEPPWKTLPWQQPPCPIDRRVKVVHRPPDIVHKGSLIDFFI